VLIACSDGKERISSLFGSRPLTTEIALIARDIWGVNIRAEEAMREYGEMVLKSRTVYKAVFDNRYVRSFFAAVPGLHQWAILGKAWFHATEQGSDGRQRFDAVLFDAPATGHGLDMLRVPKIIVDIVPPGILRRDAERAWDMFRDERQSGVVIVALAEDMPANESIELAQAVRGELGLPIARLIVNSVLQELFDRDERSILLAEREYVPTDPGDRALMSAGRRATAERVQVTSLRKLAEKVEAQRTLLPRLLTAVSGPDDIRRLSQVLDEAI
jgi:hypothetical protein